MYQPTRLVTPYSELALHDFHHHSADSREAK
jgi:CxxC motif-containing protein (DUF1111 family)